MRGKSYFARSSENHYLRFTSQDDLLAYLSAHPQATQLPWDNPDLRRLRRKGYWRPVSGTPRHERLVITCGADPRSMQ